MSDVTFPRVRRVTGNYNLCDAAQIDAQYIFTLPPDAPKGTRGFTVPVDSEWDSRDDDPLGAAEACLAYAEHCLYNGSRPDLQQLVAYLDENRLAHRIAFLRDEQERLHQRLKAGEEELAELYAEAESQDEGDGDGDG